MIARRRAVIVLALAALPMAGCATGDPLAQERTVFSNPLAINRTGIGPQCEVDIGRDATCLGAPLAYAGGRSVRLGSGEIQRLTRQQRRILRERAERLDILREQQMPAPPPTPPATPGDTGKTP